MNFVDEISVLGQIISKTDIYVFRGAIFMVILHFKN